MDSSAGMLQIQIISKRLALQIHLKIIPSPLRPRLNMLAAQQSAEDSHSLLEANRIMKEMRKLSKSATLLRCPQGILRTFLK